jgi:Uma2 family endonuclease
MQPMALTVGDRAVRPLTADEVLRMVELGVLSEDEPVELLHGVLTEVSAKTPAHEAVKLRLHRWLMLGGAGEGYDVRVEAPIVVPDRTSLPEPDVAVVAAGGDPLRHPTTALLVVEVAVSSLAIDTKVKPALYAAAGVPELWVVDVDARRLRLFGDPGSGGYGRAHDVGPPAQVRPQAVAVEPLDLAELFAGLA